MTKITCKECDGQGKFLTDTHDHMGQHVQWTDRCYTCNGTGMVDKDQPDAPKMTLAGSEGQSESEVYLKHLELKDEAIRMRRDGAQVWKIAAVLDIGLKEAHDMLKGTKPTKQ